MIHSSDALRCVMHLDSGRVIVDEGAHAAHEPASMTKMATLYLAFEALTKGHLRLDDRIPVSERSKAVNGTKLGLTSCETVLVHDAIAATATLSANDAATCLAEAISGSVDDFVKRMNVLAARIGLSATRFRTPTGLSCAGQLSTPRDMAALATAIYNDHPSLVYWLAQRSFVFEQKVRVSTNTLLDRCPGMLGGKTGRTPSSGWNLAAVVERDGYRVVGVVMGCATRPDRDSAMVELIDRAYAMQLSRQGRRNVG